ncbi:MAG: protein tyrosine/serine phosphatase [Gammaproteobacteria bacterium]|nr:protein tyrosine/serine phosphatase [Gammaproteobacteria bacterium]
MKAILVLSTIALLLTAEVITTASGDVKRSIPFDTAAVHANGQLYRLSWHAGNIDGVKIYAGTDPSDIGTGRLVASGGSQGSVTLANLPARTRWYFEFVPGRGDPVVLADRSLHLTSASNFRDVGGYRTEDGRWVRMGVAYRSNGLAALTESDYGRLKDLGLKLICDLRLEEERRRLPDPEIPNSQVILADVAADSGHRGAALSVLIRRKDDAAVINFMKGAYRDFVDLPSAQVAYRMLFERLADPNNLPTVFHCTAGKDRTGWAQAVLLSILHVPRQTIVEDYLLTDRFLSATALEQLRKSMPDVDLTMSKALTSADPEFLAAAFAEVDERYGSLDAYLKKGLGLDTRTVERIRANFIQ